MRKNKRARRSESVAIASVSPCLDGLPSEVLVNILERLDDTLQAVRICTLSKKMLKLKLPAMLSQLVINIGSIERHRDTNKPGDGHRDLMIRANRAVIDATDKLLSASSPTRENSSIRRLSIRFVLRALDLYSICGSLTSAMATHKLTDSTSLEFDILTEKSHKNCDPNDLLNFGQILNTFLVAYPDVFASLTRLRLENMRFGSQQNGGIPGILHTCKRLESLRLSSCDSGTTHSVLWLRHDELVELEIDRGGFARVELISLPKLQRLRYNTCRCPYSDHCVVFGFTPQLSKLSLAKTALHGYRPSRLSEIFCSSVPSITDLHLDFTSQKIWVQPECPKLLAPVLGKLRRVNLDNLPEGCDIAWTMFILEAAPSLKEICITIWDHWCDPEKNGHYWERADLEWEEPSSADLMKHENLAKLTIYGFQPDQKLVRYVRHVMVAAVNTVEISLHERKVCSRCKDKEIKQQQVCPVRFPQTWLEECLLRKEITEGLEMEMEMASPAVINFIHGNTLI